MFRPPQHFRKNLSSFMYGMNNQIAPDNINDLELADCENFQVDEGSIITSPGVVQWDDNAAGHPGPFWGGVGFKNSSGYQVDVRQRQSVLEYSIDGAETWTTCTLPAIGSPAATVVLTEVKPTFAQLNDILIYANGTDDTMTSTDGITWTIPSPALPKAKVVFNNGMNRIIFAAQPASPYRIDWSDINDPLTIGANSYQLIDPNSNGTIVGMSMTPSGINLVHKKHGLYAIASYLQDGAVDVNFIGAAGCMSHHTIATTENSVIWAGFDGLYEFIGGAVRRINSRMNPIIRNDALDFSLYSAIYYNGKYRISLPDDTVSLDYCSQEYVLNLRMQRPDPLQPYPITRNRRYIGCYWVENFLFDYGEDSTLFVGGSRATAGSPAVSYNDFGFVNDYRDTSFTPGVFGAAQTCFFVTKYFTEDIPYQVKRFKKFFIHMKLTQDTTLTLSYRFVPYGEWIDKEISLETDGINWIYDDGTSGTFSEGYSFSADSDGAEFIDIENSDIPRGIQFKVSVTTVDDVSIYNLAYSVKPKPKFR